MRPQYKANKVADAVAYLTDVGNASKRRKRREFLHPRNRKQRKRR